MSAVFREPGAVIPSSGHPVLEVVATGLPATIQDAGRPDAAPLGVPRSGACDPLAMAAANILLGNDVDAPVLEMPLLGPTLRVLRDVQVALAGADLGAEVAEDGRRLAVGRSAWLSGDTHVVIGAATDGARGYLALPGGIDVPRVLGSASTAPVGGIGGIDGRPLEVGDRLRARSPSPAGRQGQPWPGPGPSSGVVPGDAARVLRVLTGPHADRFTRDAATLFEVTEWEVSPHSDRGGVRLEGPELAQRRGDLPSMGMAWGAVQVPVGGRPIVLLADGPTVGGYPVIAVVITADRPVCGQLRAGDRVRFVPVSSGQARTALEHRRHDLDEAMRRLSADGR